MQIAWTVRALLVDVRECCVDCVFGLPRFLLLGEGGEGKQPSCVCRCECSYLGHCHAQVVTAFAGCSIWMCGQYPVQSFSGKFLGSKCWVCHQ